MTSAKLAKERALGSNFDQSTSSSLVVQQGIYEARLPAPSKRPTELVGLATFDRLF